MEQAAISEQSQILWQLSDHALTEAAGAIASLTQIDVQIRLLSLGLTGVRQAVRFFDSNNPQTVAVSQRLEGMIKGSDVLLMNDGCSKILVRDLLQEKARLKELTELEEESLIEFGNIIMNKCLSNYAELLQGRLDCDLPVLQRGHASQLLQGYAQQAARDECFYLLLKIDTQTTSCEACILWDRMIWDQQH